jgi:hypothetical protein
MNNFSLPRSSPLWGGSPGVSALTDLILSPPERAQRANKMTDSELLDRHRSSDPGIIRPDVSDSLGNLGLASVIDSRFPVADAHSNGHPTGPQRSQ